MIESNESSDFLRPRMTPEEMAEKSAKHKFKQVVQPLSAAPNADLDKAATKAEEMLKNFKWGQGEDVEDEEEGTETFECDEDSIQECVTKIVEHVSKTITTGDFNTLETGIEINYKIPLSVHNLLQERFNNRWTLESRFEQMDRLRAVLESSILHPEVNKRINSALQSVLPPAKASWEVVFISLDDDDVVVNGGVVGEQGDIVGSMGEKSITVSIQIGKQHG